MKKKSLIYLIIVFAALLLILLINRLSERSVTKISYFVEIDTSKVDGIHIVPIENEEVTLKKIGGEWRLTSPIDFLAEQHNVEELLKRMTEMQIENLVTSREQEQANYELDDSSATLVELYQGDKLLTAFYMGKAASTFRHNYFREVGSNDICMVKGSYKYHINRKLSDWRNKIIIEIPQETIEGLNLIYPDTTISLSLQDTIWMVKSGEEEFQGTRKTIDPILNYLKKLRCSDFYDLVEGEAPPDFSKPDFVLEIFHNGGQKEVLSLVPEGEGDKIWFIAKVGDATIYKVYKGTASLLMRKLDDFRMPQERQEEK